MDVAAGLATFTGVQQRVLRLLRREHFVLLHDAPASAPQTDPQSPSGVSGA